MSSNTTVYDVVVRYTTQNQGATQAIQKISREAESARSSLSGLKTALAAIASVSVLRKAKEALFDFNSEMDKLKIGMTTVMQMNMHMPFEKASAAADRLFTVFQDMAKHSPVMTKDFMNMAAMIAPAVAGAGGDVNKLIKMTRGSIGAGLAFNIRPEQMAMDIQEMFMGSVRLTSRTARQLLASRGLDHHEFNAKSASERAQITESILADPAILKSQERAAHTMGGEISTLKDNLQIAFGEIGRPLMAEITADFRKINQWVDKHPEKIKQWVTDFSNALKTGFGELKSIAAWFVEHQDLILNLGKVFLAFKAGSLASGVISTFTSGLASLGQKAATAGSSLELIFGGGGGASAVFSGLRGLVGVVGGAGGLLAGFTALALIVNKLTGELEKHEEEDRKARLATKSLADVTGMYPGMRLSQEQLKADLSSGAGSTELRERLSTQLEAIQKELYNPQKLGETLRRISDESVKLGGADLSKFSRNAFLSPERILQNLPNLYSGPGGLDETLRVTAQLKDVLEIISKIGVNQQGETLTEILKAAFPEQFRSDLTPEEATPETPWKGLGNKDINITINRVEVASDDPDRFVFGLVSIAEDGLRHATQSAHTLPGGF